MNKPIYLHIAFYVSSPDYLQTITGDCYVSLTGDSNMRDLKAFVHNLVEKQYPGKEWPEPTFLAITELSDELYFRLFPERKGKDAIIEDND